MPQSADTLGDCSQRHAQSFKGFSSSKDKAHSGARGDRVTDKEKGI